jgi:hypothetical protein
MINLLTLAPATLPLAALGFVRAIRRALASDESDRATVGGTFWVVWLAVAALVPAAWPSGPRSSERLFLLVPMNLLAAQAIADLAGRRASVRTLTWLLPTTVLAVAWSASSEVRAALAPLAHLSWPGAAEALGLHLGLDLLVLAGLVAYRLDRWSRCRDGRQRVVLGSFLAVVVTTTAVAGMREVRFRHRETREMLALREMILRLHQDRPFTLLAVVSPDLKLPNAEGLSPGGRLRFILRSALPQLPQYDLTRTDELLNLPEGRRLVILVGTGQRLPYAIQSRLGLEAIHPGRSGVLDAFATAHDAGKTLRR